MDKLIDKLQNFNFTRIEAQVYLSLIKNGQLNGSQISKLTGISRTSIYSSLDNLYQKGYVFMLPGEPTLYKAQDPEILIETIKNYYSESIDVLENNLSKINNSGLEDQYWNTKGYDNFIVNVRNLLSKAQKEVYISTNLDLQVFKDELLLLSDKSVRIILFSFENLNISGLPVEFYHHNIKYLTGDHKRWMMVIDNKYTFISNENHHKDMLGTITDNRLMVSIVSEHIHHDIYLLKLKQKYNKDIIEDDILINSLFEIDSSLCDIY